MLIPVSLAAERGLVMTSAYSVTINVVAMMPISADALHYRAMFFFYVFFFNLILACRIKAYGEVPRYVVRPQ